MFDNSYLIVLAVDTCVLFFSFSCYSVATPFCPVSFSSSGDVASLSHYGTVIRRILFLWKKTLLTVFLNVVFPWDGERMPKRRLGKGVRFTWVPFPLSVRNLKEVMNTVAQKKRFSRGISSASRSDFLSNSLRSSGKTRVSFVIVETMIWRKERTV